MGIYLTAQVCLNRHVYCSYAASSGVALIDPFSAESLEVVN